MKRLLSPALLLLLASVGCERHFFHPEGTFAMDPPKGITPWHVLVEGCSRDPIDNLPPDKSTTIVSLFWGHPPHRPDYEIQREPYRVIPERLDFSRTGGQLSGNLVTNLSHGGLPLNSTTCKTLTLTTSDGPAELPNGRSTLQGSVDLDCQVSHNHVTATIRFTGCEF